MSLNFKAIILSIPLLLGITACNDTSSNNNVIYTSFYPVYDLASRIIGNKYELINLTPIGMEPHDYELTARGVAKMIDSKALFINGLGMEEWYTSLPNEVLNKTLILSDNIKTIKINNIEDPHIWLNPINAIIEMNDIAQYMIEIDNLNKSYYEDNLIKATQEFIELDIELQAIAESLNNKYIVTSHAAFAYMCDRYGLKQISIKGLEPDDEPSAKTMEEIIRLIDEYHITTIFSEEMVSQEIATKIAQETGAKIDTLNPIEGLKEEDIGIKDYISIMKENFNKIKEADNK